MRRSRLWRRAAEETAQWRFRHPRDLSRPATDQDVPIVDHLLLVSVHDAADTDRPADPNGQLRVTRQRRVEDGKVTGPTTLSTG